MCRRDQSNWIRKEKLMVSLHKDRFRSLAKVFSSSDDWHCFTHLTMSDAFFSERDINFLMKMALEKVAFLPFGYMIDKYRWEIFRGNIDESNYESKWWEYRYIQRVSSFLYVNWVFSVLPILIIPWRNRMHVHIVLYKHQFKWDMLTHLYSTRHNYLKCWFYFN